MSASVLAADNTSARAKAKHDPLARKPQFRTVLDNPLQINWPAPSAAVRRLLLEALTEFLESPTRDGETSIAEWRISEHARRRGRTAGAGNGTEKAKAGAKGKKRSRAQAVGTTGGDDTTAKEATTMEVDAPNEPAASTSTAPSTSASAAPAPKLASATATASQPSAPPLPRPAILDHLTIGINDCTRALESRIRWGRWELGDHSAAPPAPLPAYAGPPASRRGHKRRHRSARATPAAAAPSADAPEPTSDTAPATALVQPEDDASTGLPPFLVPPSNDTGPVRILPNHDQLRPANPRFPAAAGDANSVPAGLPIVDLIFVCRPDINPPALVAHLPTMAAAANGVRQALQEADAAKPKDGAAGGAEAMEVDAATQGSGVFGVEEVKVERPPTRPVYLVPLDVGAEHALAAALALRRVAAIGTTSQAPHLDRLLSLVEQHIPPLQASWLVPHLIHPITPTASTNAVPAAHTLIPTHIKHLRTTAPVDPKAANAVKKEAKQAARDAKRHKGTPKEVYMAED